jgi:hypothetical protein
LQGFNFARDIGSRHLSKVSDPDTVTFAKNEINAKKIGIKSRQICGKLSGKIW